MKYKNKMISMKSRHFIYILIIYSLTFLSAVQAQTNDVTISKDTLFHLRAYDTYFSFSEDITASKVEVFEDNVSFYDVQMGTGPIISKTSFAVENANMTITNLFADQRLILTVETPSDSTSQVRVYWPYDPAPGIECTGCTDSAWTFDPTTRIVTLDATHTSSITWTLFVELPSTTSILPCKPNGEKCSFDSECCSGHCCIGIPNTCKASCGTGGGGGGGCPILKVYDGKEFIEVEKLNIHAPKDTFYTSEFNMKPMNGNYEIILEEAAYLPLDGSHIDHVSLIDEEGNECRLISAIHSRHGDVLQQIGETDNSRIRTFPDENVRLTFTGCSGERFTFTIEGYNFTPGKLFKPTLGLLDALRQPIVIIVTLLTIVVIFGVLNLVAKKK